MAALHPGVDKDGAAAAARLFGVDETALGALALVDTRSLASLPIVLDANGAPQPEIAHGDATCARVSRGDLAALLDAHAALALLVALPTGYGVLDIIGIGTAHARRYTERADLSVLLGALGRFTLAIVACGNDDAPGALCGLPVCDTDGGKYDADAVEAMLRTDGARVVLRAGRACWHAEGTVAVHIDARRDTLAAHVPEDAAIVQRVLTADGWRVRGITRDELEARLGTSTVALEGVGLAWRVRGRLGPVRRAAGTASAGASAGGVQSSSAAVRLRSLCARGRALIVTAADSGDAEIGAPGVRLVDGGGDEPCLFFDADGAEAGARVLLLTYAGPRDVYGTVAHPLTPKERAAYASLHPPSTYTTALLKTPVERGRPPAALVEALVRLIVDEVAACEAEAVVVIGEPALNVLFTVLKLGGTPALGVVTDCKLGERKLPVVGLLALRDIEQPKVRDGMRRSIEAITPRGPRPAKPREIKTFFHGTCNTQK